MRLRGAVAGTATGLAALAMAAPILWSTHPLAAWAMVRFFSFACHQDPTRSLWLAGAPMAVCARCIGIYLGAAAGVWIVTKRDWAIGWLVLAAGLNLLDLAAEHTGMHGNWIGARFVLGLALGSGVAALVAATFAAQLMRTGNDPIAR